MTPSPAHQLTDDDNADVSGRSDDFEIEEGDAKDLVALHVAATLVPKASLTQREQIRANWHAALVVVWEAHANWAIAYVPGYHHGEAETYAVHKRTGRVVGGDCPQTATDHRESTHDWLTRVAREQELA